MVRMKTGCDKTSSRQRRPRPNLSQKIHVGKFTFKSHQSRKASSSYRAEESRSDIDTCHLCQEDEEREGPLRDGIREYGDSACAGQDRLSKRSPRRHEPTISFQQTEQNRIRTSTTKIVNALAIGTIATTFAIIQDIFVLRFLPLVVIGNVAALCWQWIQFFTNSQSFSTLAGINQTVKQLVLYQYNKTVEGGALRRKAELVVVGVYHECLKWLYHWWYYSE